MERGYLVHSRARNHCVGGFRGEVGAASLPQRLGVAVVNIIDPIYGRFETPKFLDPLVMAPEVRRLQEVRLINAPSPSLPALSDVRRFSHTLGVLFLALQNPHIGLTRHEVRALLASVLIHDAATPPFAHLLEYYLRDFFGWDHESAIRGLLTGHQTVENSAFQILPGEQIRFQKLCSRADIEFGLVLEIVGKTHRSSRLLFGVLDLDNLDNIARMAWAMGMQPNTNAFVTIARALSVDLDGGVLLSTANREQVGEWAALRRRVYEILVFDEPTVAAQAVLTKAIRRRFSQVSLDDITWLVRDKELVEYLSTEPETKQLMLKQFNSELPRQLLCLPVPGTLNSLGFSNRDEIIELIEKIAGEVVPDPTGYAFIDNGAFSKRLQFRDPASGEAWEHGEDSRSIVLYCFARVSESTARGVSEWLLHSVRAAIPGQTHDDAARRLSAS